MKLKELYEQTPRERHQEILVSGNRLLFYGEKYFMLPNGELKPIHSIEY